MVDGYATAGLHRMPPQQPVKIKGTVDGIFSQSSPYGYSRDQAVVSGATPLFSLKTGEDDEHSTFDATGFNDVPVFRNSVSGVPVPIEYEGEGPENFEKARQWLHEHAVFRGITATDTELRTQDIDRKYSAIIGGSADCTVAQDVKAMDFCAWEFPTREEIDQRRQSGSMLEKQNPEMISILPLDDMFFAGNFASVMKDVMEMFPNMKALTKKKSHNGIFLAIKAKVEAHPEKFGALASGKINQLKLISGFLWTMGESAKLLGEIKNTNDSAKLIDLTTQFSKRSKEMMNFSTSFYMNRASRKCTRAIYGAKGGFTAHLRIL